MPVPNPDLSASIHSDLGKLARLGREVSFRETGWTLAEDTILFVRYELNHTAGKTEGVVTDLQLMAGSQELPYSNALLAQRNPNIDDRQFLTIVKDVAQSIFSIYIDNREITGDDGDAVECVIDLKGASVKEVKACEYTTECRSRTLDVGALLMLNDSEGPTLGA